MDGAGPAGWAGSEGDEEMRSTHGFAHTSETGSDAWIGETFKEEEEVKAEREGAAVKEDTRVQEDETDQALEEEASPAKTQVAFDLDLTLDDDDDEDNSSDIEFVEPEGRDRPNGSSSADGDKGARSEDFSFSLSSRKPQIHSTGPERTNSPSSRTNRKTSPDDLANVPPEYPLPEIPRQFHLLNHAPMRDPGPPAGWTETSGMTSQERTDVALRELSRGKRVEEQMKLREEGGEAWEWEWELLKGGAGADVKGKGKARETGDQESASGEGKDWHDVAFFPSADHDGLSFMRGVFAVCGGRQVKLLRVPPVSSSSSTTYETLATATSKNALPDDSHNREEFFTIAWSVNISTRPYCPILAVAGRGRVIEIYLVDGKPDGSFVLHHDRTITGHGGSIFHLAFHPTRPHLLASASLDHTIRFVDPTLPWGRNDVMFYRITAELEGRSDKKHGGGGKRTIGHGDLLRRRKVPGELLAVANEGGHGQGVLNCDFHASQPLLVACGMDGFIHTWRLPESLLSATPAFPTTSDQPVFRHPDRRPVFPPAYQPPSLPPPIFSSLAIHPGQWPTTVRFASHISCLILSCAPVSHNDARFTPRKSVKLWVPHILDVGAPNKVLDKRQESLDEAYARLTTASKEDEVKFLDGTTSKLFPPQPHDEGLRWKSSSAFRVQKEMVLEGQNVIGDKVGWYSPRAAAADEGGVDEQVLVMPTSLPVAKDGIKGDGLYFFRPFASTRAVTPVAQVPSTSASNRPLARAASHLSASSRSSTPISSTHSQSTKLSAGVASISLSSAAPPPPTHAQRLASAAALFPPSRDRLMHDFHPRHYPSFIAPLPPMPSFGSGKNGALTAEEQEKQRAEMVSGKERATPHFRSVAVQPEGAEVVVAVGEGGAIGVWRTRRKGERLL